MVYMYQSFLIHSSADGHLGCFHVLAMINSAAMNIGMHVSLSDLVSLVCMPRSGIAGSYGSSISSFLRKHSNFYHLYFWENLLLLVQITNFWALNQMTWPSLRSPRMFQILFISATSKETRNYLLLIQLCKHYIRQIIHHGSYHCSQQKSGKFVSGINIYSLHPLSPSPTTDALVLD